MTKNSLKDLGEVIMALLEWKASFEYSDKIAGRVRSAISIRTNRIIAGDINDTKDGKAVKVTLGKLPGWVNRDTLQPNEKVETVNAIFTMYLNGKGAARIARELNQKKVVTLGNKGNWAQSVIYGLLSNRQVLGEYTLNGETVTNYLPLVVDSETFHKVQAKLNDNRGKRPTGTAPSGLIKNMFSGVAFCKCGSAIKVIHGKGGNYFACYSAVNGAGCSDKMVKFNPFESAFVQILRLDPAKLVRDETDGSLNAETQIIRGQLAEAESQINNITEAIAIRVNKALVLKQEQLEIEIESLKGKLQLAMAKTVSVKGSTEKLSEIVSRLENLSTDNELRQTVQEWIRSHVNKVTIDRVGKTFTVDLKTGNVVTMNFEGAVLDCKSFVSLFTGGQIQDSKVATA